VKVNDTAQTTVNSASARNCEEEKERKKRQDKKKVRAPISGPVQSLSTFLFLILISSFFYRILILKLLCFLPSTNPRLILFQKKKSSA